MEYLQMLEDEKYGDFYLVLHKVRGAPAFDVAINVSIAEQDAWVVSSSGHRCFPYWYASLKELFDGITFPEMPEGIMDHFEAKAEVQMPKGTDVLKLLGLGSLEREVPKEFKRRI